MEETGLLYDTYVTAILIRSNLERSMLTCCINSVIA